MVIPIMAMALAAAPVSPPLKGSAWTVEFADTLCALAKTYKTPAGMILLVFKAPLIGRNYGILVVRPGGAATVATWHEGFIVKPGGGKVGPFPLQSFTSASGKRIMRFSIDAEKYALAEDGSTLTLDLGSEGMFSFAVPSFPKALATLEDCTKGLRQEFGIDQQIVDRVAVDAKPLSPLFSPNDYPRDALRQGEQGTVGVLAFVGTDGRVSGCRVIETSNSHSLDSQTCAVLNRRARYEPARDASGMKMLAPIYTRVRWVLPGRPAR